MKGQGKGESSTEKGKGKGKGKKGESSHRRDEEDDAPVKGKPGKGRGKEKGKGRGKGKGKTEGKGKRKIVWIDGIPHYPGSDVPGIPSGAAAMGVVPPTGWYRDPLTGLWVVPEEEEQPEQPVQPPQWQQPTMQLWHQTEDPYAPLYWPSDEELWEWLQNGWIDHTMRFGFDAT